MQEESKAIIDVLAIGGTVGTVAGILPPLAALITIVWTCLRIWETDTIQNLFNKKKSQIMLPQIISGVVGLASGWLDNKKAKQQATHEKDIELIKSTTDWEMQQAKNSQSSWKDEWFTLVLSIPLLGAFVPDMVPYIHEGFRVLNDMPDFYKGFLGAAVAASFGVKALSKWGSK